MEATAPSAAELDEARQVLEAFAQLGRRIRPDMRNATRGEMAVIFALHRAGEPLTSGALSQCTHLSSARVANVLRALEGKGLIERTHSSEDRRQVLVSITSVGEAELARRREHFEQHTAQFLSKLGQHDTHEALRIINRINTLLDEEKGAEHEDRQAL